MGAAQPTRLQDRQALTRRHWAFDRRFLTILLIVFVQMIGSSMVNPILPLYAQSEFDLRPEIITLLLTAFFAAQFIAGPFIGRLSDRRGRLPVLLLSQVGTVIAFLMIGLAQSAAMLFVARVLDGVTGGNIIVAQAYVTDIMPEKRRTQALGYVMAAFGLGFIVGPALGGLLASQLGPSIPFLCAALAALATVVLTWFTLEETVSDSDQARNRQSQASRLGMRQILANSPLLAVLTVAFVGRFAFGLLIATFALFAEAIIFAGYDFAAVSLGVGLMLMFVGLGQFFTQIVILPAALKRLSDPLIVIAGAGARALGMFIFALATEPILGSVSMVFIAIGSGLLIPALQSLVTKTVPPELRGTILGLYQSAMNLGVIVSTAVSGALFAWHPTLPNWTGGILYLLTVLPALLLWHWTREQARKENEAWLLSPQ